MSIGLRSFVSLLRMSLVVAALGLGVLSPAAVRADFPERTVTLLVCFPAGGGTDIAARLVSTPLSQALGKPVVVENRGGAGGNIGIAAAAHAAPDGHTLLVCSSAFVVNPSLYAKPGYDPVKDFIPIMVLGGSPNVYMVPKASPIKTLPEFIAKAKANPGKLNWTSPGAGTTPYLAGEILKMRASIDIMHIPFTGAGPAMQAGVAGQVEMLTANYGSVAGLLEAGSLRALAQTGKKRWPELPDIPTLNELGIHDAETDTIYGVFAPAGTPKPVVDRLVKELTGILAQPDIQERFRKAGAPVVAEGPDAFRARMARELPMYKEIVEKAGLKIN